MSLLDLPAEVLTFLTSPAIISNTGDLASLAASCKTLYQYVTPVLWKHIKLDLTISTNKSINHLYDSTTSAALFNALSSNRVSCYAFASIRQLSLNLGKACTTSHLVDFCGAHLLNPKLTKNLTSVTFHGATWRNIKAISTLMQQFPKNSITVAVHDISLSCLIELALPVTPLNDMLRVVSLQFSSIKNNCSDIDLLSKTLRALSKLHTFALSFNSEFDLCDDPFLEERISSLFRNMALNNRKISKVAIYDFPPYLHFSPLCLPSSVREFVFHTNEIDCEALFFQEIFSCSAKLKSLSVRIVQSIEQSGIEEPADGTSSNNSITNSSSRPLALTSLQELTLDAPSASSLLPAFVKANRRLSRVALSGFSTNSLCQLLHLRHSLRQLYIYSFSSLCSPACPSLVIHSAMSSFTQLRLVSIPQVSMDNFRHCIELKRQQKLHHLSLILSHNDSYSFNFASCSSSNTSSSNLLDTPPTSPPSCSQATPPLPSSDLPSPIPPNWYNLSLSSSYPLLNDRTALWSNIPFKSVDELDLFTYHHKNQLCVL